MNVLREMRKFKSKSVIAKIRILILLFVMLIVSTYAWFYTKKEVNVSGLRGKVTEWDLEYSADGNLIEEKEYVIAVDYFYPGSYTENDPFEKVISIYNKTITETIIDYSVTSVKLFGEEILDELKNDEDYSKNSSGISLFSTEKYPFEVNISYDKSKIEGVYESDATTPNATAKCTISAIWEYERIGETKDLEENDKIDSTIGELAYNFYQTNPDEPALEVTVKINSGREGFIVFEEDE